MNKWNTSQKLMNKHLLWHASWTPGSYSMEDKSQWLLLIMSYMREPHQQRLRVNQHDPRSFPEHLNTTPTPGGVLARQRPLHPDALLTSTRVILVRVKALLSLFPSLSLSLFFPPQNMNNLPLNLNLTHHRGWCFTSNVDVMLPWSFLNRTAGLHTSNLSRFSSMSFYCIFIS